MKLAIFSASLMVPLVLLVTGCGSSPSAGIAANGTALASGGASSIYVIQNTSTGTSNSILQFAANSNGAVSPSTTLLPPVAMNVGALATDSAGQIYVAGTVSGQYEILVYAAGASGSATPLRTIIENTSSVVVPYSMAVDSAGVVYVMGQTSGVAVFAANASGVSSPVRLIQGALTQLTSPNEITADGAGNIYVTTGVSSGTTSSGAIVIFSPNATGNVAPARVITAASIFTGIAVDSSANIYTTEDTITTFGTTTTASSALVQFAAGASGTATPTRSISGSATGLSIAGGLGRDSAGNVFIVNAFIPTTGPVTFNVVGFGPSATGNVAPGINFSSTALTNAGSQLALK